LSLLGVEFVTSDVAGDFLAPECFVGLGDGVLGAAAVAVPEAAVDEDDGVFRSSRHRKKTCSTERNLQPAKET